LIETGTAFLVHKEDYSELLYTQLCTGITVIVYSIERRPLFASWQVFSCELQDSKQTIKTTNAKPRIISVLVGTAIFGTVTAFAGYMGYYPSVGEGYGIFANYYEGGAPGYEWTVYGSTYAGDASSNDMIQAWSDAAADAASTAYAMQCDIEYCITNGENSKSDICTYQ
jgi:hypothetical protein